MNNPTFTRTTDISSASFEQPGAEAEVIIPEIAIDRIDETRARHESIAVGVGPIATRTCQDAVDISDHIWSCWQDPLA